MITANNLAEAVNVLDIFKDATLAQLSDPEWVGRLQGRAHVVTKPIKNALEEIELDVEIA